MTENEMNNSGKVMLAWSNGKETHLHPSMMFLVEGAHLERLEKLESREKKIGHEQYSRELSREYERYSDELKAVGLKAESYKILLLSSTLLFSTHRSWINRRVTSWYHPNLKAFRRLYRRCLEQAKQDKRLWTVFVESETKSLYDKMTDEYDGFKDPMLWDSLYSIDGDDPLCD